MKQVSGYFGGYISKKQKLGQYECKKSISALPLLRAKLVDRKVTHASHQLSHVVNRMFTTLESKGILRMATEEFMLAANFHRWDSLSSEFIRSCREANFYGRAFLERVEAIASHQEDLTLTTILPGNKKSMVALDIVSLYGFRPPLPCIWYCSAFGFCQWFFIHRLRPPGQAII